MKEINIDRVYPLNRHHNIKILHDLNPLKSFTLFNASLDLYLSRSLISQLCLDNSDGGIFFGKSNIVVTPLGQCACPEVALIVKLYERSREREREERKFLSNAFSQNMSYLCQAKCICSQLE